MVKTKNPATPMMSRIFVIYIRVMLFQNEFKS